MYFIATVFFWSWYTLNSQTRVLTCIHAKPQSLVPVTLQLQCAHCHLATVLVQTQRAHTASRGDSGDWVVPPALSPGSWCCSWRWKHSPESATPAVWTVFMLFQMSSEVQPALHSFLWDLLVLPVGPRAWKMHPQRNKHCVPNLKDVSIWAPSSQRKPHFLGSKAETFPWACCQDHLFEVVSATIQSYTICCLFTVCYNKNAQKKKRRNCVSSWTVKWSNYFCFQISLYTF